MIRCQSLSVKYNETYGLHNLDLQVKKGGSCAIIGQSGCGKTTLLHTIAGLLGPTHGNVTVNDEPLSGQRSGTSIILQKDGLFPWKTVYNNITLGMLNKKLTQDEIEDRVMSILKELEIEDQKDKYLNQLSGGQRQRVAIARAIAMEPDLLLMDEPSASLDRIAKERFQDQLLKLYQDHDLTMVLVTHDIEEAAFIGQQVVIMEEGKVKKVIENPLFLQPNLRGQLEFYEFCMTIRQVLSL
jgi:NitT/TauT family transport system ATP-binding protein